jgi:hypothetical protein
MEATNRKPFGPIVSTLAVLAAFILIGTEVVRPGLLPGQLQNRVVLGVVLLAGLAMVAGSFVGLIAKIRAATNAANDLKSRASRSESRSPPDAP